MARENLNDLATFVVVAREKNFTRAAAQLGVSQSALSHTIRGLEERLGVRLLTRTTRSVTLTDVGAHLLSTLGTRIDDIHDEINLLGNFRDKPSGSIRISTTDYAINTILWPKLQKFCRQYPDIKIELIDDYRLTDIVSERYDAGTRLGEQLQNGMISVRIGPDIKFTVVGAPSYFAEHDKPKSPQDLIQHNCINMRFVSTGGIYAWEFEKDGHELAVRVEGQLIFNGSYHILEAAKKGFGLGHLPLDIAQEAIDKGELIPVLEDWFPPWQGYYLYYPSKRQHSMAFRLLVDALRYKG
ncbi:MULTISPECIES: LysR family transcriptional regulator [unclassified Bartonella]|uniref:LysR family transcriptional regulator n=1 Tax=unclassified Bartonella TaxID=2645622 RepID=UPI0015F82804|nr:MULTISPECIES: LysR family transcriptional regulator [unclassified Bartonella]UXN03391.1 LysR family transcriptional regulator [Bartonella sp. HY406]UXN06350.1 LysR family transcriptional regulator [Bartonella sp. HY761]